MHLQVEELIDLAEGTRAASSAPHLTECETCRRQLEELRLTMAVAAEVEVPEPSPLFWDHLSRRVSNAVASERAQPAWRSWLQGVRVLPAAAFVAAALLLVVALNVRSGWIAPSSSASLASATPHEPMPDPQLGDSDPSLVIVAELTSEMDLDGATEAGLAPQGSAEHAVTHMDRGELRELQRLLKEELANSGA
jgi:hypothetical protein